MFVTGADAVRSAEGNTEARKRPSAEVPSGSKSRARSQGFPRHLGSCRLRGNAGSGARQKTPRLSGGAPLPAESKQGAHERYR